MIIKENGSRKVIKYYNRERKHTTQRKWSQEQDKKIKPKEEKRKKRKKMKEKYKKVKKIHWKEKENIGS